MLTEKRHSSYAMLKSKIESIDSNPMLTDGFAKEIGHQDVQVYTRDREEEKEEQVIVDCDSRSDASLVSRHMTSDGQGRKIFL